MESYLRFLLGIGPKELSMESEDTGQMDFYLDQDEDGTIRFESDFGPNPPELLVELQTKIIEAVEKMSLIGAKMDPTDIQNVIGQQFLIVLGEPDIEENIMEHGIKMVKLGWNLPEGGSIFKIMEVEPDEVDLMDKDSIEYQKHLLNKAIKAEDYQKAAEIRDHIKTME